LNQPDNNQGERNPAKGRKFLVVVDDTQESRVAVRFAGRRAQRTGASLVLLRVIVPNPSHTHWLAVEERMREEAYEEAEVLLQDIATEINEWAGLVPAMVIRQGEIKDEVLTQIEEDSGIDVLVLAASPGPDGPGPLVTALVVKLSRPMRVPVTVVPGNLNDAQVDRLT
jgi:nucleotide-binding universal stress UspA family protein